MLSTSLIQRIVDRAFNRGNLDVLDDVLAPDYHAHVTIGGVPHG